MTDCKCRHGKKEHEWNRDARARIGKCRHKDKNEDGSFSSCGCTAFHEPEPGQWFKDWEECIRNLSFRK